MKRTSYSLPADYVEFIALLEKHGVPFLIIGGVCFAFHAQPQYTKDIDFWIRRDAVTAEKMLSVVTEFGFGNLKPPLTSDDFLKRGSIVQLGHEPVRIDILNDVKGALFESAWERRVTLNIDGAKLAFLDRDSLTKILKKTGRMKDLARVDLLKKLAAIPDSKPLVRQRGRKGNGKG